MFFLKPKNPVTTNGVKPYTVYKDKYDSIVFVCDVSRPKSQNHIEIHGVENSSCVVGYTTSVDSIKLNLYLDSAQGKDNFGLIHSKKTLNSVVVLYKTEDILNETIHALPLAKFMSEYELVIGYKADGTPITESMILNG